MSINISPPITATYSQISQITTLIKQRARDRQ
jgi:hypothetical protein